MQAVDLDNYPQTAVLEGTLDQMPSETHREGQTTQMIHGLRVEEEGAVANHLSHVTALHQIQRLSHYSHVDALGSGAALHTSQMSLSNTTINRSQEVARLISEKTPVYVTKLKVDPCEVSIAHMFLIPICIQKRNAVARNVLRHISHLNARKYKWLNICTMK
jgi:hypothetical protein